MSSGIPIFIGGGWLKKRGSPDSSSPEVGISDTCEKRKSSHSSAVRLLYCLANFSRAAHCLAVSRGFFCLLSGLQHLLFINLQMVFFPPSWPLLANCCESCLVEFPLLNLALILFRIIVLAASLRIFGLPVFFLSSNLSFLDDHFTTQSSDFSAFWKFLSLTSQ